MRPRNPLSALLRLRSVRERQARGHLGVANRAERTAKSSAAARRQDYMTRPRPPAELAAMELRILELQGVRSAELLEEAASAYREAAHEAERVRREWINAQGDAEKVRKLEMRRRQEVARLAQAAAQRAIDELVLEIRAGRPGKGGS